MSHDFVDVQTRRCGFAEMMEGGNLVSNGVILIAVFAQRRDGKEGFQHSLGGRRLRRQC